MPRKAGTKSKSPSKATKGGTRTKSKKLRKDEVEEESAEEEEEDPKPKPKRGAASKKKEPKTKKKASKKEEEEDDDDVEEEQTAKKRKTNSGKGKAAKVVKGGASSAKEKILPRSFYSKDVFTVSKALLGKIIVRHIDGEVIKAKIVDVEAFGGAMDKASHAYNNKKTAKNDALYLEAGHAYVFTLQQVNAPCLNITTSKVGDPSAAMIRGVEIIEGMDIVSETRKIARVSKSGKEYANGPGKLCEALQIDKSLNKHDLTKSGEFYIIEGDGSSFDIVTTKRVKIDYAEEFNNKPWRYCIKGNTCLSAPAKPAKEEDEDEDEEEEEDEDE